MKWILGILGLIVVIAGTLLFAWLQAGVVGAVLAAAGLWQIVQSYRPDVPRWARLLGWPMTLLPWFVVVVLRLVSGWSVWLLAGLVFGVLIYLGRARDLG